MGIYDRDYVREQSRKSSGSARAGGVGLGLWSANTWLIVICVAVFILDRHFLPVWYVPTGHVMTPEGTFDEQKTEDVRSYSRKQLVFGRRIERQAFPLPSGQVVEFLLSIHDRNNDRLVGWAPAYQMRYLESWLYFSTSTIMMRAWDTDSLPQLQFWRFIGFQFLHFDTTHLLFNMIGLFFFGPLVEQYLGSKRYLAFYLLAGICGAVMYLILNLGGFVAGLMAHQPVRIPGLLFNDPSMPLVGASAGVFGVLMAAAYIAPRELVYFFGLIPIRMKTLAYLLVGLAFFTILTGGRNAGGEASHLGGAIAGFYFIRRPHHLHNFFDVLGRVDPTSHHYRQHRRAGVRPSRAAELAELDRILEKIHVEGMDSLTESERRMLRDASERGR